MSLEWRAGAYARVPRITHDGSYRVEIAVGGSRGPLYVGVWTPIYSPHEYWRGPARDLSEDAEKDCQDHFTNHVQRGEAA